MSLTTDERIAAAFERIATAMEERNRHDVEHDAQLTANIGKLTKIAAESLARASAPAKSDELPAPPSCVLCGAAVFPFGDGCEHFPPPPERAA